MLKFIKMIEKILALCVDNHQRLVRIETRLCKLAERGNVSVKRDR